MLTGATRKALAAANVDVSSESPFSEDILILGVNVNKRRRFGRVRQLPSGRWQARYAGPDGRQRTADTTFGTSGEAARWLAGVETDLHRGAWLDPKQGAVTLRSYAKTWIDTRTVQGRPLRPRTLSNYRSLLRLHIEPTLGKMPLSSISPERVRVWHAGVAKVGATTAAQSYRSCTPSWLPPLWTARSCATPASFAEPLPGDTRAPAR